tara:strand:- start:710 stop:1777 length:1068 start_codon:yes stop_codon:yes gene_type:complete
VKWIGQHIVDLIARFRGDIYLEGLATTTESSVLVVDSSGKVSKSTSVGGDITSVVAGTGLNGGATSGAATINIDVTQSGINTIINAGLKTGRDSHNFVDFGTDNQIEFTVAENQGVTFKAAGIIEATRIDATDVNAAFTGDLTGEADTVATIAGLAPDTATTQATQAAITTCANLTTTGTIGTGVWEGTKVADDFLSDNTAHLDTFQTFTGRKNLDKRDFNTVGGTDGDCKGDIIVFGTDASSHVAGNIYTLNPSSQWVLTDADATATSIGLLAVAMGTSASDGMCIRGMASLKTTFPGSPVNGDVLYLDGATPGAATGTAPTGNGDIVRVLGYKIGSGERMWFNPDNTFIEVTA